MNKRLIVLAVIALLLVGRHWLGSNIEGFVNAAPRAHEEEGATNDNARPVVAAHHGGTLAAQLFRHELNARSRRTRKGTTARRSGPRWFSRPARP